MNNVNDWRWVKGFAGRYSVNQFGQVRTHNLDGSFTLKKPSRRPDGYYRLGFGRGYGRLLHRVVATAFLDNPTNLPQVNHIDGDKANNVASNLEWISASNNLKHAYRIGIRKPYPTRGEKSRFAKLKDDDVRRIRTLYSVDGLSMKEIARMYGLSPYPIRRIIKMGGWSHVI